MADTAAAFAEDSDAVSLVDHNACIVFLREFNHFADVGNITLHGEHTVGNDEFHLVGVALLELLFERLHVVVLVFELLAERETAPFDNRSVILLIPENVVLAACKG